MILAGVVLVWAEWLMTILVYMAVGFVCLAAIGIVFFPLWCLLAGIARAWSSGHHSS